MAKPSIPKTKTELTRDSALLRTLYAINNLFNQIASGLPTDDVLPEVLLLVVQAMQADEGSLFIVDDAQNLVQSWLVKDKKIITGDPLFLSIIIDEGLAGHVMRGKAPLVIEDTTQDAYWMPERNHPSTESSWSAICVPLATQIRIHGVITLSKAGANQFKTDELNWLTAVTTQTAYTIANNQLYQDSKAQAESLATLVTATAAVTATLDTQDVCDGLANQMVSLVQADAFAVFEWHDLQNRWHLRTCHTQHNYSQLNEDDLLALIQSASINKAFYESPYVHFSDEQSKLQKTVRRVLRRLKAWDVWLLPLISSTELMGVGVLLLVERQRPLQEIEISLMQTLAGQAAVALQNAKLYTKTQHQLRITELLNKAGLVINSSLDFNFVMQSLLYQVNEVLRAEAVSISLLDKQRDELVFTVSEGIGRDDIIGMRLPSHAGVTGGVLQTQTPAIVNDTSQDERFHQQGDKRTGHKTEAMICAPIIIRGESLGTVQAINPADKDYFTKNELSLLVNLASLASSAMANAQQYEETQEAEARYIGLFQDNVDPMILTDKRGVIREVNKSACEMLEYEREELVGTVINRMHPVETGLLGEQAFKPIKTQQVKMVTSKIITKNNRYMWAEVYAKRIHMGDDQILQWTYHDVTEHVELREMREDLTAMLFHDLRNPIGNIISSLELAIMDLPENAPEGVTEMLDVSFKSSEQLARLVKSLLDINRLESGQPIRDQQFTKVRALLDDARESVAVSLERRHIELLEHLPHFVPDVYGNRDMIQRVITNLMDNALKYSQDNGRVIFEVKEPDAQNMVRFAITDEGPGIPKSQRTVIFDKYKRVQVSAERKGLGLGLAFCRLAIEAHGGRIWVDEGVTGGARFNFTLPVVIPADVEHLEREG